MIIKMKGKFIMIKSTKTDWQRLNRHNNKEIDYSDIPKTDVKFWENSEIIAQQNKVDFTLKIDEDLALWLKGMGTNSEQAVNKILSAFFLTHA